MNKQPQDITPRVYRGGGWISRVRSWARAGYRSENSPSNPDCVLGFRCALRGREPRV